MTLLQRGGGGGGTQHQRSNSVPANVGVVVEHSDAREPIRFRVLRRTHAVNTKRANGEGATGDLGDEFERFARVRVAIGTPHRHRPNDPSAGCPR
jgi:hypothetical protein